MIGYLIILLDHTSASFCHYGNAAGERKLMSVDTLRTAIRYAMVHNWAVQIVYPRYEVPDELKAVIETVDSCRIMPVEIADGSADVVVVDGWDFNKAVMLCKPTTLRITKSELFERYAELMPLLTAVPKLNVVITDVHKFSKADFETYKTVMKDLREKVAGVFLSGGRLSVNLLTDRLMLEQMNNCGAGDTSITFSPDGKFYICPAFYYDAPDDSVGSLCDDDIAIDNAYLYTLKGAPICRHCDAWHCKRCVWMNRLTTREVNTPSHEQCVVAHIERDASRLLLDELNEMGKYEFNSDIPEIDYFDPFETRDLWK